jgi:hypothetical protein
MKTRTMKTMLTADRYLLACISAKKEAQAILVEAFKKVGKPFEPSYANQLNDYSGVVLKCLKKILFTQEEQK